MTPGSATPPSGQGPGRQRRARGLLPLWAKWALCLLLFGVFGAGFVAVYRSGTGPSQSGDAAASRAEQQGRSVVAQDQAPHSAALGRGIAPRSALERAIAADTRGRIRRGELQGPAKRVSCIALHATSADRRPFRCTALAAGIRYPFRGVADLRAGRVTWCKHDPVAPGEQDVPVSPRCRA